MEAREIIEESATIQNIIQKKGTIFYALEAIKEIRGEYRKIRVVIIEDKKKNKIFLSVMDKKIKNGAPHA